MVFLSDAGVSEDEVQEPVRCGGLGICGLDLDGVVDDEVFVFIQYEDVLQMEGKCVG